MVLSIWPLLPSSVDVSKLASFLSSLSRHTFIRWSYTTALCLISFIRSPSLHKLVIYLSASYMSRRGCRKLPDENIHTKILPHIIDVSVAATLPDVKVGVPLTSSNNVSRLFRILCCLPLQYELNAYAYIAVGFPCVVKRGEFCQQAEHSLSGNKRCGITAPNIPIL